MIKGGGQCGLKRKKLLTPSICDCTQKGQNGLSECNRVKLQDFDILYLQSMHKYGTVYKNSTDLQPTFKIIFIYKYFFVAWFLFMVINISNFYCQCAGAHVSQAWVPTSHV